MIVGTDSPPEPGPGRAAAVVPENRSSLRVMKSTSIVTLIFATVLLSCFGRTETTPVPDATDMGADLGTFDTTGVPDTPTEDGGGEDAGPELARFGEPCDDDWECESRLCVETEDFVEGYCSQFCTDDDDCDDGWSCVFLIISGGDGLRACAATDLCIDGDGDGFGRGPACDGSDCDDEDGAVFAGADELCNGFDDDCDGVVDENPIDAGEACTTELPGVCGPGVTTCDFGLFECVGLAPATTEICNAIDDDCNGYIDDDSTGAPLAEVCYPGPPGTAGIGICAEGVRTCVGGVFSQCAGLVLPSIELCNGLDDDCDEGTDEGDPGGGFDCNTGLQGICAPGVTRCEDGEATCARLIEPGEAAEVCNGLDDDCDGEVDDGESWALLGDGCIVGVGECVAAGAFVCDPADPSGPPVCSAVPGDGVAEVCNGLDDDCDGESDEDAVWSEAGEVCFVGDGICQRAGVSICDPAAPEGPPVCSARPGTEGVEVCNGLDDDCDGDVDDGEPWTDRGSVCFVGVGACRRAGILVCDPSLPGGPLDCTAVPGSEGAEVCNGLDDDCDGEVDDLAAELCPLQRGVCEGSAQIGAGDGGFLDCTTLNYGLEYELVEITCDGLDNDCDGEVDDVDVDRDGFVDVACGGTDCDDLNPLVNPEAPEVCGDLVDNDCNDVAEDRDVDGDGFVDVACGGTDCNDRSGLARPGLDEVCGDFLDNDCDGSADNKDIDGDSFRDPACGGTDCDDDEGRAFPGNPEVCDGVDNDCSDVIDDKDTDGDGFIDDDPVCGGTDCDDGDIFVNPDAAEICGDDVDDDCSGELDDRDVDGDTFIDADPACGGDDCIDTLDTVHPDAAEIRDGEDNDCDLLWDEGLVLPGELIVTEAMPNPSAVLDSFGEWLEVYNTSDTAINLNSFRLHDDDGDSWTVLEIGGVYVAPGAYATLCRFGLFAANGGVVCDATYDDFVLANGPDEIILSLGDVEIDRVNYDRTFPWTSNTTMSLRPDRLTAAANDLVESWCPTAVTAENQLAGGDYGTPRRESDCR